MSDPGLILGQSGSPIRGYAAAVRGRRTQLVLAPLALLAAIVLGFLVTHSPPAAGVMVGCAGLAAVSARVGRAALAQVTLGALPWFVIFADLMPPLVKTFTAAAAVFAVFLLVAPLRLESTAVGLGAAFFVFAVAYATAFATTGDQLIQAAKYVLFPVMAIAMCSEGARRAMPELRGVLMASGVAAIAVHLVIIVMGLGAVGTYYGAGEKLGFASHPHDLALLGMIVAAAGLTATKHDGARFAYLCIGTLPAIATGVRSAMVAALLVVLVFLFQSRFRLRSLALVAGLVVLAIVTGAAGIVTQRYQANVQAGEFTSLTTTGSGRPSVWTNAVRHWRADGPRAWVFGTGLDSIQGFTLEDIGEAFGGHSDLFDVGVQLGLLGFVGWLLIWLGLLRRLQTLVLVPLAAYAVVNGGIEYVDSVVFGFALAAACIATGAARQVSRR